MAAIRGFSLSKISKISIVFSSFDPSVASTREFLRRVTCTNMKESNPKCQIAIDVRGDYTKPQIHLKFKNGDELDVDPLNRTILDIVAEVNNKTKLL